MDNKINSPEDIDKLLKIINKRKKELKEETKQLIKNNQEIIRGEKN